VARPDRFVGATTKESYARIAASSKRKSRSIRLTFMPANASSESPIVRHQSASGLAAIHPVGGSENTPDFQTPLINLKRSIVCHDEYRQ
jgi:hypothetical protein